jgi:glutamyl-tRNA reductase
MSVVVIGLSHRTCPVAVRERFAFAEAQIPAALTALRDAGLAEEAVILSTCNRVEIYAATPLAPAAAFAALRQFLLTFHAATDGPDHPEDGNSKIQISNFHLRQGYGGQAKENPNLKVQAEGPAGVRPVESGLEQELYTLAEPESLHHLFRVAGGLDSMVLGETEILGQLKKAYDLALQHRHTGARLNKAFQRAFHTAKHIRTDTNIQRGSISIASVAVELAEKIFSSLAEHEVLVIGAGDTSEKTARALISRGARGVVFANRSPERAQVLAAELGGRAVPFEDWPAEFHRIDIAISSTSAPHFILDRRRLEPLLKQRGDKPLLLIDIAVPRDIDPEVNYLENVYLYNVDDLQAIADDYLKSRQAEIAKCEQIIADKVAALLTPPAGRAA